MKYLLFFIFGIFSLPAFSQFVHRNTLVGTGGSNFPSFGTSVAISADGNVAVVGGETDSAGWGAAWVYTRNGNTWTQMGKKLKPNDGVAGSQSVIRFGGAVAISANGNTIAIAGRENATYVGATWIFVRSGNKWVQQGPRLEGSQTPNQAYNGDQGKSISLSGDGNTLVVGGNEAVWFFQRTGVTWAQQGPKITSPNFGYFGNAVAITADGNSAIIGAPLERYQLASNLQGFGYIYRRILNTWTFTQKITDLSYANGRIGEFVAISGNGDIIALGGPEANFPQQGSVYIFRYNAVTQLWAKEKILNPNSSAPGARFGRSISISKGSDTLVAAGYLDNNNAGAVWSFTYNNGTWSQLGPKITVPANGGTNPLFGRSVSISGDGKIFLAGRPGGLTPGSAHVYSDPSVLGWKENLPAETSLYPNPIIDFLQLPTTAKISHLTVSDLTGKVLLRVSAPGQRLDLSTFSSGIYIVSLQQQDKVWNIKIVKE